MTSDYENWLEESGLDDTPENQGWFECPQEDSADYINNHSDWWEKL